MAGHVDDSRHVTAAIHEQVWYSMYLKNLQTWIRKGAEMKSFGRHRDSWKSTKIDRKRIFGINIGMQ